jgi:hypothetical protein
MYILCLFKGIAVDLLDNFVEILYMLWDLVQWHSLKVNYGYYRKDIFFDTKLISCFYICVISNNSK